MLLMKQSSGNSIIVLYIIVVYNSTIFYDLKILEFHVKPRVDESSNYLRAHERQ